MTFLLKVLNGICGRRLSRVPYRQTNIGDLTYAPLFVGRRCCRRRAVAQRQVLLGHRKTGRAKSLADRPIGIEVNLPIMIGMTVRSNREHRPGEIELEDLDVRS